MKRLKTFFSSKGYECLILTNNGVRKHISIHREVAIAYIPNPDNKPEVNHMDGIKSKNIDTNLEWMTPKENKNHMYTELGETPIRNFRNCILRIPSGKTIDCKSVSEAARIGRDSFKQSYSSLRRYRKTNGYEIIRNAND